MCAWASCACAAVAVRPVPIAQTGSYAMTSSAIRSAVRRSKPSLICRSSTPNVSLRSRSSSVSPTHTIGVSSAPIAATILRLTIASLSPNSRRRSECPTITYSAPASLIIPADTSPVNAPSFSQYRSWAATAMFVFRAASAAACSAVNGGATTTSTPSTSLTALRSSFTNTVVSWTVLNIFQLPAMKGALISPSRASHVGQRGDAGKRPAAEKFERRAAARGDVRNPVGEPRLLDRRDRIAAADDRGAAHVRDGARDRVGSRGEHLDLEDPHRAVPHHRFRVGDQLRVGLDGLRPD